MKERKKRWHDWRKHPYDPALQQVFTNSMTVSIATQFLSRRAKEDSLRRTLSTRPLRDKQVWTKLRNAAGNRTQTEIPVIVDPGRLVWATSSEKPEAFARFFSKKSSILVRTLRRPQTFLCQKCPGQNNQKRIYAEYLLTYIGRLSGSLMMPASCPCLFPVASTRNRLPRAGFILPAKCIATKMWPPLLWVIATGITIS